MTAYAAVRVLLASHIRQGATSEKQRPLRHTYGAVIVMHAVAPLMNVRVTPAIVPLMSVAPSKMALGATAVTPGVQVKLQTMATRRASADVGHVGEVQEPLTTSKDTSVSVPGARTVIATVPNTVRLASTKRSVLFQATAQRVALVSGTGSSITVSFTSLGVQRASVCRNL